MLVKHYRIADFLQQYQLVENNARILNAGSGYSHINKNSLNVDIQDKEGVDVVCDLHDLPESIGTFDAVICSAVLQYCHTPDVVAQNFMKVMKPGALLYVEAPWIQAYNPDTPDRFRFSEPALRSIFKDFNVLDVGASITSGSAFYLQGVTMAHLATGNKYLNHALMLMAKVLLYPFKWITTASENRTAGGLYIIAQKPA